MTFEEIYKIKLNAIYNIYMYIETSDKQYKLEALSELNKLLKAYGIPKKLTSRNPLKSTFTDFLNPSKGALETINKLINAL